MMVRDAGLFVFVEVADLGLVLQWDRGTRAYIRLHPKWKGLVSRISSYYVKYCVTSTLYNIDFKID